jgi:hypothetical protein
VRPHVVGSAAELLPTDALNQRQQERMPVQQWFTLCG